VEEIIVKLIASRVPTFTRVAPEKFVPVILKVVPPSIVPKTGAMEVIAGGAIYVNALALVAVPPAVVTVKLLAPAVPAGVLAVIEVALTTTTLVAATPFTFTLVAPVKLVPVIVNAVPPKVVPEVGAMEVIVGAGTT